MYTIITKNINYNIKRDELKLFKIFTQTVHHFNKIQLLLENNSKKTIIMCILSHILQMNENNEKMKKEIAIHFIL